MKSKFTKSKNINSEIILPTDWTYYVDYESNRSYCSGDCDDYCRCTTVSPVVNSIHYSGVLQAILDGRRNKLSISEIKEYCVDRAIRKIIDIDSIDAYGVRGYYGEDVGCELISGEKEKLQHSLDLIVTSTEAKAIEHVLELEYGYVLDDLKNKSWEIKSVNIKNIKTPYTAVSQKIVDSYTGDETVLCMTVDIDRYRLIDGNHRFVAAIKNNKKKMKIITCEE